MRTLLISLLFCSTSVIGQDVPTLFPASPFNPSDDANALNRALDGLGTNEDKIIDVLCYRTASQRDEITIYYDQQHGSLVDDLVNELNGNFETLSVMLTHGMIEFLSIELHEIMAPLGTNEPSLTEVMISRSNQELLEIDEFFLTYYNHTLAFEIEADTIGSYQKLLLKLAGGSRDESTLVDMAQVEEDVVDLYNAGPANEGVTDRIYINIFSQRNFVHLNEVSILYEATYGTSLTNVVTSEFPPDMGNALSTILIYSYDKANYFATRFLASIEGFGSADRDLMRLTVSRCEIDLGNIKVAYQNRYGTSLSNAVAGDTAGSFSRALLALIG